MTVINLDKNIFQFSSIIAYPAKHILDTVFFALFMTCVLILQADMATRLFVALMSLLQNLPASNIPQVVGLGKFIISFIISRGVGVRSGSLLSWQVIHSVILKLVGNLYRCYFSDCYDYYVKLVQEKSCEPVSTNLC